MAVTFSYMKILFPRCSITASIAAAEKLVGKRFQSHSKKKKEGVVVIMGATGTGKSKLSVDVAAKFAAEIVNADKIQVYRGLDVTTNKLPPDERRCVPHHLLGELDPAAGELRPSQFRALGRAAVSGIAARGRLPVIAGGSNSYIHALMSARYDERDDPFAGATPPPSRLRYRSCLLWVDVQPAVLAKHLDRRVDDMVELGMVEELDLYFSGHADGRSHPGLAKAIGVTELRGFFRRRTQAAYDEAIAAIKANTRRLADDQVRKIARLRDIGWPMKRLDASLAVAARLAGDRDAEAAAWERGVLAPALFAVERFLKEDDDGSQIPRFVSQNPLRTAALDFNYTTHLG